MAMGAGGLCGTSGTGPVVFPPTAKDLGRAARYFSLLPKLKLIVDIAVAVWTLQ